MRRYALLAGSLTLGAGLLAGIPLTAGPKKPELRLRAVPRMAVPPVSILFIAELVGGDDHDASLHCLRLEWDWGDGGKSVVEPQCQAFVPGETRIERRFSAEHEYRERAQPSVEVRLKRDDKVVLKARTQVILANPASNKGEIRVH